MNASSLTFTTVDGRYAVCRLAPGAAVELPDTTSFFSLTVTDDEISLVCEERLAPADADVETPWRIIKVIGPLDFSLTGILSALATTLADAGISIFAISTFDTDYLLVKENDLDIAVAKLRDAGHTFKA